MIVVGGPPGAGKSTLLPVRSFGVDAFNIDDRCYELHGSYIGIPKSIRAQASAECERFILDHIDSRQSFAVETTMRTSISIEQARLAKSKGFTTLLWFLCADDPSIHVRRIIARAANGGHSAPEAEIRRTYAESLQHLVEAFRTFDLVECFDTTAQEAPSRWIASVRDHCPQLWSDSLPAWMVRTIDSFGDRQSP